MLIGVGVSVTFSPPRVPFVQPPEPPATPANAVLFSGQPLTDASGEVITHGA